MKKARKDMPQQRAKLREIKTGKNLVMEDHPAYIYTYINCGPGMKNKVTAFSCQKSYLW